MPGMEMRLNPIKEARRNGFEGRDICPEPVAGQLVLEKPPHPLHQVESGGRDRQPERDDACFLRRPPRPHHWGPVIADVVHHQHDVLIGPGPGDLVEEGDKPVAALVLGQLPDDVASPLVHRPKHGPALVFPGGGHV